MILDYFKDLSLIEFSLIPEHGPEGIIIGANEERANKEEYGCGCFVFKKK